MANLKTTWLGLELDNPIIVGSSGLTKTVEGVKRMAAAGAGAVVLKSLFEEEVRMEYEDTTSAFAGYPHPEASGYLESDLVSNYGAEKYLQLVRDASQAVSVPVIASINCVSPATWTSFAAKLEAAGAKALELNVFLLPLNASTPSDEVEKGYIAAVKSVTEQVKIPVAVKLVPYLTNVMRVALHAREAGVDGLVLFNKFFHPDIDIDRMTMKGGLLLSRPDEYRLALRWIGLLYGRTQCDLCASTGIHDGKTVLKQILAGASAAEVTSAIYLHTPDIIEEMLTQMREWMDAKGFASIDAFRGKLSRFATGRADMFERAQYIKAFVGAE